MNLTLQCLYYRLISYGGFHILDLFRIEVFVFMTLFPDAVSIYEIYLNWGVLFQSNLITLCLYFKLFHIAVIILQSDYISHCYIPI